MTRSPSPSRRLLALLSVPALCALAGPAAAQAPQPDALSRSHTNAPREDPPGLLPVPAHHPRAAAALAAPRRAPAVDATTYHYDGLRTGWNRKETELTPEALRSGRFGLLETLTVDGNVFAQPLVVSDYVMPDGRKRDVLVVATGHNTVYAYDARSLAPLWQVNLGPAQPSSAVGCEDVTPEYGISSTPVILRVAPDRAAIYVVAATMPSAGVFETHLHALNLGTGQDLRPPTKMSPTATKSDGSTIAFDAKNQWSRAGLAFANGSVYVAIGSHCDNNANNISGWMLRYDPTTLKLQNAFNTVDDPAGYELSSIWMTGFAPAVDALGRLFVITGNGAANTKSGGRNYGESVLRLPPALADAEDTFTPNAYRSLNRFDSDFGSGGVMLLPTLPDQVAPPMAVAMGKDGTLYLLDQTRLGGVQPGDAGALQVLATPHGVWGGPAYYGGPTGPYVYYQTDRDVMRSYKLSSGATPSLTAAGQGTTKAGYGGSTPIVTSNGLVPGTALVWTIRRGSTVQLEAYDAVTLGAPVYAAGAGSWGNPRNNAFVTPQVVNGRVYVGATNTVSVFGLAP